MHSFLLSAIIASFSLILLCSGALVGLLGSCHCFAAAAGHNTHSVLPNYMFAASELRESTFFEGKIQEKNSVHSQGDFHPTLNSVDGCEFVSQYEISEFRKFCLN